MGGNIFQNCTCGWDFLKNENEKSQISKIPMYPSLNQVEKRGKTKENSGNCIKKY